MMLFVLITLLYEISLWEGDNRSNIQIPIVDQAKKENTLISGNVGDKKNLHPSGRELTYF